MGHHVAPVTAQVTAQVTGQVTAQVTAPGTALAVVLAGLVVLAAWAHRASPRARVVGGPPAAALFLLVGRAAGLSWTDLGLGAGSARTGAVWALALGALVAVAYVVALAVPRVRRALRDDRYRVPRRTAVRMAVVVVPLATVLVEEVAFRGVLWGLLSESVGPVRATLWSGALFGVWHLLPALDMARRNVALRDRGGRTALATVAVTVVVTAVAGVLLAELRRRSGSLLAPIGVHWAVNGLGILAAARAWATGADRATAPRPPGAAAGPPAPARPPRRRPPPRSPRGPTSAPGR
ncbi:MAG TPA: CPBP family intramembrane glutamic endopeptidase [Jiangellales bacterium]|nr:CPBP family intramembrane glutamic endopeptidase [Jiangellales bacterium]